MKDKDKCVNCKRHYSRKNSDALENEYFCSKKCEDKYYEKKED